jgi:hypothetical protein
MSPLVQAFPSLQAPPWLPGALHEHAPPLRVPTMQTLDGAQVAPSLLGMLEHTLLVSSQKTTAQGLAGGGHCFGSRAGRRPCPTARWSWRLIARVPAGSTVGRSR